jgi:hypothetical protein
MNARMFSNDPEPIKLTEEKREPDQKSMVLSEKRSSVSKGGHSNYLARRMNRSTEPNQRLKGVQSKVAQSLHDALRDSKLNTDVSDNAQRLSRHSATSLNENLRGVKTTNSEYGGFFSPNHHNRRNGDTLNSERAQTSDGKSRVKGGLAQQRPAYMSQK